MTSSVDCWRIELYLLCGEKPWRKKESARAQPRPRCRGIPFGRFSFRSWIMMTTSGLFTEFRQRDVRIRQSDSLPRTLLLRLSSVSVQCSHLGTRQWVATRERRARLLHCARKKLAIMLFQVGRLGRPYSGRVTVKSISHAALKKRVV